MAATVSPWSKPGAWALDSEEQEAELLQEQETKSSMEPLADFPSLSAAASAKPKKKKGQTLSLAEFTTYGGPKQPARSAESVGLTHEDRMALPKGPRERSAEELDRNRLGGGFRSYGDRGNRYSDRNGGDESSNSRWGSSRGPERNGGGFGKDPNRDSGPSRADEADNWASAKKPLMGSNGFERRERGFFSDSQSKADESDNWVSNKSLVPSSEGRRFGANGGGFERERKVGFTSNGGGADSDYWGKKKEETNGGIGSESGSGGGRPRLNLQPRTLPVVSDGSSPGSGSGAGAGAKPKGSNPFGAARPREEVLAEKGQDWKKIDEQLESVKIKEVTEKPEGGSSFGKKGFGIGNGRYSSPNDRTEKSWKKPGTEDDGSQSAEKNEDAEKTEDGPAEEN